MSSHKTDVAARPDARNVFRHTPVEVAETRSLLEVVEQQITTQERLIAAMRTGGRPTSRARNILKELQQSADLKRDHIKMMQREYDW